MENKLKFFYLRLCPHCKKAQMLIDMIKNENPKYANIEIEKIEESEQPEIANSYDYHLVPTFFVGNKKLHEGTVKKEDIIKVFDNYLMAILPVNN
ncbi:MAG: glutaredoxin [Clostridiales bacterium]|nr:glutaredoxin [Clostridiales bacterium]